MPRRAAGPFWMPCRDRRELRCRVVRHLWFSFGADTIARVCRIQWLQIHIIGAPHPKNQERKTTTIDFPLAAEFPSIFGPPAKNHTDSKQARFLTSSSLFPNPLPRLNHSLQPNLPMLPEGPRCFCNTRRQPSLLLITV